MLSLLPFNYGFASTPGYSADGKLIVYSREQLESVLMPAEAIESRGTASTRDQLQDTLATTDPADVNNLDVSRVTNFSALFVAPPWADVRFDVSDWDVSKGREFRSMFENTTMFGYRGRDGDLKMWDVSQGTDFRRMFRGTEEFNGDVTRWDVSKATKMHSMFRDAKAFWGCTGGCQNMGKWDVSKVTEFNSMFRGAPNFQGTIRKWKISNANTRYMFANTSRWGKRGGGSKMCAATWDLSACIKARMDDGTGDCVNVDGMFEGADMSDYIKCCLRKLLTAEQLVKATIADFSNPQYNCAH